MNTYQFEKSGDGLKLGQMVYLNSLCGDGIHDCVDEKHDKSMGKSIYIIRTKLDLTMPHLVGLTESLGLVFLEG